MKKVNFAIVAGVIILCLAGWIALATQKVSQSTSYNEYIEQADEWVSMGLYQRAIQNYELVLAAEPTEELYVKTMEAYQLRYEEAPDETEDDYVDFLEEATSAYPANKELVDHLVTLYTIESNYEDMYTLLQAAIANGYNDDDVQAKLLEAKYAFSLKRSEFSGIKQSVGNIFSAARNQKWDLYNLDDGYIFSSEYEYIGLCSEDGVVVVTGDDSRIVTTEGMVLGIFDGIVTDAGVYAEGLLPACVDGKYAYYDEFAAKQFGNYDMAGMFQNGYAAVKSGDKWVLVNTSGEEASDSYEKIVLDYAGRYLVNGVILAKKSDGVYGIYDENWNLEAEIECTDVDICTSDGLIAVCQNEKWGFANTSGEIVIEPTYDGAKSFSNGMAAVCKDGLWGFINKDNVLVIDYQFSDTGYMNSDGICPVRTDEPNEDDEASEEAVESSEEETSETSESEEQTDDDEVLEIWKFLELTIGLKED